MKLFYVIEKGRYYFQRFDNTWPTWVLNINNCMQFTSELEAKTFKYEYSLDGKVIEHAYED